MKKMLISTDAHPFTYFLKKFKNMLRESRNIGSFVCLFNSKVLLVVITKHGLSH